MDTHEISRILLADDGSEPAEHARAFAVDLAARAHAKLSIVYVLEPLQSERDARRVIASAVALADERGVPHDVMLTPPIGISNPGRRIITAAEECGADLIVMGARGLGGVGRLLLGSVSSYVVHHAHRSVLIAR